jgi:hypothetical protein
MRKMSAAMAGFVKPDPKLSAENIEQRTQDALKAMEKAIHSKDAEKAGASERILSRINNV